MSQKIDLVYSFDTTGSMYPCLAEVRRRLSESIGRLFSEVENLRVGVIAHGDYCDDPKYGGSTYDVKHLDLSQSYQEIRRWINGVARTGGGDAPECYEKALQTARTLTWQDDAIKVLVMIGDDVPHPVDYRFSGLRNSHINRINWRSEASTLSNNGVAIYAIQCLNRRGTHSFWKELGSINGYRIELNQFNNITETILALAYKQIGDERVREYRQEVQSKHRLNRGMAALFNTILGEAEDLIEIKDRSLVPVSPSRFQTFRIDHTIPIKEFVLSMGIEFRTGRGFYTPTKAVIVQERKEIVLRDKRTGDMFTGETARNFIGLPFGERGKIYPRKLANDKWDVFVQSTSYNRKLLPRQEFMYEVA